MAGVLGQQHLQLLQEVTQLSRQRRRHHGGGDRAAGGTAGRGVLGVGAAALGRVIGGSAHRLQEQKHVLQYGAKLNSEHTAVIESNSKRHPAVRTLCNFLNDERALRPQGKQIHASTRASTHSHRAHHAVQAARLALHLRIQVAAHQVTQRHGGAGGVRQLHAQAGARAVLGDHDVDATAGSSAGEGGRGGGERLGGANSTPYMRE